MDQDLARTLQEEYGDSYFVWHPDRLARNVATWRDAFEAEYPSTRVVYPYKANDLPAVCREMADLNVGAEVCSALEWHLVKRLRIPPDRVVHNGSGRPAALVAEALVAGALVMVDSVRDARIVGTTAAAHPHRRFTVGIRCDVSTSGQVPSRLGVSPGSEEWSACLEALAGVHIGGLHCHAPGGDPSAFAQRTEALITVADRYLPGGPDFLDVGGGFYGGVPATWPGPGPTPTPQAYARAITAPLLRRYRGEHTRPTLVIEPGAALVASTMTYATRVMDVKPGPRRPVAVVAGTLLHTSPNTRRSDFPVRVWGGRGEAGRFDVAGSTPLPDEWLALDVAGRVREGDVLEFGNVGAYTVSVATVFTQPMPPVLMSAAGGFRPVPAGK